MAETIGTARIDVVVDTSSMEVALERAKSRTASMSQAAQQQYQQLNKAEKRRVDSLIKQADTLGLTREQQIAYNAALKLEGPLLDDITGRLNRNKTAAQGSALAFGAQTKAFAGTNKTARELQFALRGLPAQITDIGVSLASGQRPMMVLLQQGGQLKDMFGGIRPAAAALGQSLLRLINPATLLAAGIGAVALALKQAEDEAVNFNRAILQTGDYSGHSATEMQALASDLDNVAGVTQRSASKAIAAVASTGRIAKDQFEEVSRAVVVWSAATGESVDDVVQRFTRLADDPVGAIKTLDRAEHFLTESTRRQIETLKDQGKEADAARLAISTYADTLLDRAPKMEENLGYIEDGWRAIKRAASEAWDAMLQGGRDPTLEQLNEWIERYQQALKGNLPVGTRNEFQERLAEFQAQAEVLRRQLAAGGVAAAFKFSAPSGDPTDQLLADWEALEREVYGPAAIERQNRLTEAWEKAGEAARKELEKVESKYDSLNDQLRRQIALFGDTSNVAKVRYEIEFGELSKLDKKRQELLLTQARNLDAMQAEKKAWDEWEKDMAALDKVRADITQDVTNKRLEAARKAADKMTEFNRQAARNMQDAFADFLFDPFKDGLDGMVEHFAKTLQRMLADLAASKLFDQLGQWGQSNTGAGGLTGFFAGLFGSLVGNAKGGVYDSPNLSTYSGEVYDSPHLFAFARGAGIFGEAGPEAIMPLQRGRDGKLGVQANGGGVVVEINNYGGSRVAAREETVPGLDGESLRKIVIDIAADDMASGGKLARASKGRFGLREMV